MNRNRQYEVIARLQGGGAQAASSYPAQPPFKVDDKVSVAAGTRC